MLNISRSHKRLLTLTWPPVPPPDPPPAPQGDLYRVKRYDEMPDYYNIAWLGVPSNFGYVQVHVPGLGEGSVTICTRLTPADVLKLKAMQIPGALLTVDQKMNRLIYQGKYVHPMWTNDDNNGWQTAAEVRNGACVFTNQKVLIDKYATLRARVPGQNYDDLRAMGRLVCFKPTDWDKTYDTHPHIIHHMTGVSTGNVHSENPHGEIFIPILDPAHFNLTPMNASVIKEYWIDLAYLTKAA
jgi:hypothetical protein